MDGTQRRRKRNHSPEKLSAVALKKLPQGWHADGGNLYLLVRGKSRAWVFRYVSPEDGARKNMGLGALDSVSLATARSVARELRADIKHPIDRQDPLSARRAARAADQATKRKSLTFKDAATQFLAAKRGEWRNTKHADQWEATLKLYAYPTMGTVAVSDVDEGHVLQVLEPIWRTKTETASRLRGRIEAVLDWAAVRKHRSGDNPARWKGHLAHTLPAPRKVKAVKHHASLGYHDVGAFMSALRGRDGVGARALEFAILTAARSGEVRNATWGEIDLKTALWTVPAHRMKAGKEHRVPLSADCIALLKTLPKVAGSDLVFPGETPKRPLSDMTLAAVLRRMEHASLTVHGFRSTFRIWAAEQTNYPREVCEAALAHKLQDKVEAAYQRSDLFEKRRQLMNAWAKYCAKKAAPAASNVTAIGGKR